MCRRQRWAAGLWIGICAIWPGPIKGGSGPYKRQTIYPKKLGVHICRLRGGTKGMALRSCAKALWVIASKSRPQACAFPAFIQLRMLAAVPVGNAYIRCSLGVEKAIKLL